MLHRMKSVNNGGLYRSNQQRLQQLRHAKSLPNIINKGNTTSISLNDRQKKSLYHDKRIYSRLSCTSISTTDTGSSKDGSNEMYKNDISTKNILLCNNHDNINNVYHSHVLLNTSWTIYVCNNPYDDTDDTEVAYDNDQSQLSSSHTQTVFRLVRNSEPQSALYLYGIEIIHCIDAIYERDNTTTFTIHSSTGSNDCCTSNDTSIPKEIYYANNIQDIRNQLYQSLLPLEYTHTTRTKSYRPIRHDIDVELMIVRKFGQKNKFHSMNDDPSNVFRNIPTNIDCYDDDDTSSFINFNEEYDISLTEPIEANDMTQHHILPFTFPLIESTMEFDDDMDSINYVNDVDYNNDTNTNFLWDDTMIQDVVSSLIAVGVYDTSIASSSLWNTLSASASSSSLSVSDSSKEEYSDDKNIDKI
jgi:hypothetical protein